MEKRRTPEWRAGTGDLDNAEEGADIRAEIEPEQELECVCKQDDTPRACARRKCTCHRAIVPDTE
jgi:hypothetical protein